jgi:hypothetical protein
MELWALIVLVNVLALGVAWRSRTGRPDTHGHAAMQAWIADAETAEDQRRAQTRQHRRFEPAVPERSARARPHALRPSVAVSRAARVSRRCVRR